MKFQDRSKAIGIALKRPYLYWTVGITFVYYLINIILSQFYTTIELIPYYLGSINWMDFLSSIVLSGTIAFLIGINSVLVYIKQKERTLRKEGAIACAATLGGFSTGICSACISGAIPLILTYFGVTLSFVALPFDGMEIQGIIIALLIVNIFWVTK